MVAEALAGGDAVPRPGDAGHASALVWCSDSGRAITVVIADDHAGFRSALEALLRDAPDVVLLGSACGGEEAVAMTARLRPQVVLMDLSMPDVSGVDATRRVRSQPQPPAVVALSGSRELMRDAVAAGATSTLLKESDPDQLLAAIRAAARG